MSNAKTKRAEIFFRHPRVLGTCVFCIFTLIAWVGVVRLADASRVKWSWLLNTSGTTSPAIADTVPDAPAIVAQYRLLDGMSATGTQAADWPAAVMIENLPSVRPQSGLGDAMVVYEALAEGGATRFMALFDPQISAAEKIGPVRSSRPYYIEWLGEYDALYAHAGGSPKALLVIWEARVKNVEALGPDGKYFWRDHSIAAPHNLFTSAAELRLALQTKGWLAMKASFLPWTFVDDATVDQRGEDGKSAEFNFSTGKSYLVRWQYQRPTNSYLRYNAGVPHIDNNTGKQLEAKNVVVQLVDPPELDGTGKGRLDIYVGGTGKAWVFNNGNAIEATWKKLSRTDRTRFYDSAGHEIPMVRGATWVHVVPKAQAVTYR